MIVELEKTKTHLNLRKLEKELLSMAAANKLTKRIQTVLFHKAFPVDIRHNSKIFREKLAIWAEKKVKNSGPKDLALVCPLEGGSP
jgi:hypothetical protein